MTPRRKPEVLQTISRWINRGPGPDDKTHIFGQCGATRSTGAGKGSHEPRETVMRQGFRAPEFG